MKKGDRREQAEGVLREKLENFKVKMLGRERVLCSTFGMDKA